MKLTYRGNAYEMSASIQPAFKFIDRLKIKLIYRGQTHYTTLYPQVISQVVEPDEQTVTLIYRGNRYDRDLQLPKPDQNFRASNWRWKFE